MEQTFRKRVFDELDALKTLCANNNIGHAGTKKVEKVPPKACKVTRYKDDITALNRIVSNATDQMYEKLPDQMYQSCW